jgi:hypothetical protein
MMGEPEPDELLAICPAVTTDKHGNRVRCWLEPDHDDPHLAVSGEFGNSIRTRWETTAP